MKIDVVSKLIMDFNLFLRTAWNLQLASIHVIVNRNIFTKQKHINHDILISLSSGKDKK